tara:strand:+ start:161 stop:514 length:354 start_codon:yes stop_codon:yes gene_type:complete
MMQAKRPTPSSQMYDLGPIDQIPLGEGRQFQIGHTSVAVFRARDGRVFAAQAQCPHRGGPLADGIIGGGQLHCPLHGYKFELDTGKPIGAECNALKTFPVTVTDKCQIQIELQRPER